jgi:3-hydroxyisobutyrate dehydrogenase-like beta-hydroxyacid dehydrogenase
MSKQQLQTSEPEATKIGFVGLGHMGGATSQESWFDIGLMQKDIGLALDTARDLHVPLPTAGRADEMLSIARALGYERRDLAAIFDVLDRMTAHQSVSA